MLCGFLVDVLKMLVALIIDRFDINLHMDENYRTKIRTRLIIDDPFAPVNPDRNEDIKRQHQITYQLRQ